MVNMDHVHGPWSLTPITNLKMLGGDGPWNVVHGR